jgi:hypothetical protein
MNYTIEVSESGPTRLQIRDPQGRVVREVAEVFSTQEACQALGRSRRHLYRYIARRWLQPAAKFSGEFFFDAEDVRRLKGRTEGRVTSVPSSLNPLFPEYDVAQLHPERDADMILSRVLERGDARALRWALRRYPLARRALFLQTQGARLLSERAWRFWSWLWGVRPSRDRRPWRKLGRTLGGIA